MTLLDALRKKTVLEKRQRISHSQFWRWQRAYYENKGISAWGGEVPFYITTNPVIARAYAKIFIGFVKDYLAAHPSAIAHPFYLLELGTGSGRFGFYLLKTILELLPVHQLQQVSVIYIMSDVSEKNLAFYRSHPALQTFIQNGCLDIAAFNLENPADLSLRIRCKTLQTTDLINPLTVIANYIFDTIPNDGFYVKNGKLQELLFNLATDAKNLKDDLPIDLKKVDITYSTKEIGDDYYADAKLNRILKSYRENLKESYFLLPVTAINVIDHFKKLSNDKLLVITSDKAHSECSDLARKVFPHMAFHGSFSVMVNYHAIGQAMLYEGGEFFSEGQFQTGLQTCVGSFGISLGENTQLGLALQENLGELNPSNYAVIYNHFLTIMNNADMPVLFSYLVLSHWDPIVFLHISEKLITHAESFDDYLVARMKKNMHRVVNNYYYLPNNECVLFEVGVFYHGLKEHAVAIDYYHQALALMGEQYGIFYNAGLCFYHLKQFEKAKDYFNKAAKLDPSAKEPKEWLACVEREFIKIVADA